MTRARRGLHEGSVFEADGKWWASISFVLNGKRVRRKRSAATKQKALDRLAELKARYIGADAVEVSKRTLSDVASSYLDELKRTRAPNTHRGAEASWRRYLRDRLGRMPIQDLRREHVRRAFDDLERAGAGTRRDGTGTAARQQAHTVLHRILLWALARGIIDRDPMARMPVPRHEPSERTIWTIEQARQFIERAKENSFYAGCVLGLGAGLRPAEIRGLRWRDVDFRAGVLHVRVQSTPKDGIRPPKTRRSKRTITMPQIVAAALAEQRRRLGRVTEYVFATRSNRPICPTDARMRWLRAFQTADVPAIRMHDLRHAAATFLLAAEEPAHVVAEILGHDVRTLLKTYAHVLAPMRSRAAARLDGILGGEPVGSPAASEAPSPPDDRARNR